ncbi:MAG: hypothetical protein HW416_3382 [Chloroflexi bacterium]|nr:hypothetical protein [Chloroflexota bacterium]
MLGQATIAAKVNGIAARAELPVARLRGYLFDGRFDAARCFFCGTLAASSAA